MSNDSFRTGYAAIVGKPNAGKSTLLNQLLKFKLSITSHKAQTTRKRVLGIYSDDSTQIIFLDTPGIIDPKYNLQRKMMSYVTDSIDEADAILYLIDLTTYSKQEEQHRKVLESLSGKKSVIAVLNKADLVNYDKINQTIIKINDIFPFKHILSISALKGKDTEKLIGLLREEMGEHPPFYDPDLITQEPERFFVSEFIREQIFMQFKDEIPYSTDVLIEEFKERSNGKDYVRACIVVERDSQKGIIIGKNGSGLKKIGAESRKEIEFFLDRPVFLELFVKVIPDWRENNSRLKSHGY
jgi:GTPase